MSTAVIISGALRYLPEASTSWKFDADYFLVIDSMFFDPQDPEPKYPIENELVRSLQLSKVHFKSISAVVAPPQNEQNRFNSAIKMAWKWKISYSIFKEYHLQNNYSSVILTRPDAFLTASDYSNLPTGNYIYYDPSPHLDEKNRPWVNDMFIITSPAIFSVLAGLYDYLVKRYNEDTSERNIHNFLFEYYQINNIDIIISNSNNFRYTPIRENCLDMFDDLGLKKEFTIIDLTERSLEWWNNKWKV